MFFKLPSGMMADLDLLGEEEEDGTSAYRDQLDPLGTPEEIAARLQSIVPEADFSDFEASREGYLFTDDYAVTFFLPEAADIRVLYLSISGSEEAFAVIRMLHDRTGWRAADEEENRFRRRSLRKTPLLDEHAEHAARTKPGEEEMVAVLEITPHACRLARSERRIWRSLQRLRRPAARARDYAST